MRPLDVVPAIVVVLLLAVLLAPAEGHLFHQIFEVRDNQLTKDYLVVVRLVDYPYEKFDLADDVYRGEQRVRLKPGGFRTWLRRSMEPGMVFKAEYQIHRWTESLEGECQRLDRAYGTLAGVEALFIQGRKDINTNPDHLKTEIHATMQDLLSDAAEDS